MSAYTSKTASFGGGDWGMQEREIEQSRKMADALREQAMTMPQGQMAGGRYVAPHFLQYAANLLKGYSSYKMGKDADEKEQKLVSARQEDRTTALQKYADALRGKEAVPAGMSGNNDDLGSPAVPAVAPNPTAALSALSESRDPMLQQIALSQMVKQAEPDNVVVGRSLLDKKSGKVVGQDATWSAEQQAAREEKARQAAESLQARRELAANASADRRLIAGMVNARQEQKNVPKLPTSALKMQQEELDAIGTASGINSDLGALESQISSGKLNLGPMNNLMSKGKNFVGISDENSRNFASFNATLEKLRNDSLRLNKGVQTEGDAQRAWQELIANANDPKVVMQRLGEIRKINERAANLRRMNVDGIRANFGVDPMDATPYKNQPPAVGGKVAPGGAKFLGFE